MLNKQISYLIWGISDEKKIIGTNFFPYEEKINGKKAFGHQAIVFGILMYSLNFNEEEAIIFHMYSTISTLIQNGVRAIPLGQKDGQKILKKCSESFKVLYQKIKNLDYSFFGASIPGIE